MVLKKKKKTVYLTRLLYLVRYLLSVNACVPLWVPYGYHEYMCELRRKRNLLELKAYVELYTAVRVCVCVCEKEKIKNPKEPGARRTWLKGDPC